MLVRLIFALVLCGISASAGAQEGTAVARVISASPDSDGLLAFRWLAAVDD
jgi:hypothetical protein